MIWFTSDEHFGNPDKLIGEYRPFESLDEFTEHMISYYREHVSPDDTVYHIGDFVGYCKMNPRSLTGWKDGMNVVNKLTGKHILILGNNEERLIQYEFDGDTEAFAKYAKQCGFIKVLRDEKLQIGMKRYYLVHKPSKAKKKYITLFGHTHMITGLWKPCGINVGVDVFHFRPIPASIIEKMLYQKVKYWDNDVDVLA